MQELVKSSALEQAELLRRGEISALELTDLYLERIADVNPKLHAFCYVATWGSRHGAKRWDKKKRRGRQPTGPLSGVPTGIKDLAFVRGTADSFRQRCHSPRVSDPRRDRGSSNAEGRDDHSWQARHF